MSSSPIGTIVLVILVAVLHQHTSPVDASCCCCKPCCCGCTCVGPCQCCNPPLLIKLPRTCPCCCRCCCCCCKPCCCCCCGGGHGRRKRAAIMLRSSIEAVKAGKPARPLAPSSSSSCSATCDAATCAEQQQCPPSEVPSSRARRMTAFAGTFLFV